MARRPALLATALSFALSSTQLPAMAAEAASRTPSLQPTNIASMGLPPFLLKMAELLDRLEGWKVLLHEGDPRTEKILPELDRIKGEIQSTGSLAELERLEPEIDRFEAGLREDIQPGLSTLAPGKRQEAIQTIQFKKRALVALHRKKVDADGKFDNQLDSLKSRMLSAGLDRQRLTELWDGVRQVGVATPVIASATGDSGLPKTGYTDYASAKTYTRGEPLKDRSYPQPKHTPARSTREIPPPATVGTPAAGTSDEATVTRIAGERGMKVEIVRQAFREAKRQGVDYRLVLAVIKTESAFNPNAVSGVGARGLMQIMPATGAGLGLTKKSDFFNIAKNIRAGVSYIKSMWKKFSDITWAQLNSINPWARSDVKKAIAAYNAGPGAVKKYGKVPPYRETQRYVVKVLREFLKYREAFPS
ncbi:lytic transglycosylase domain-containing protein [Elusimicrobiota bacterium]